MGLDATVYCTCFRDGRLREPPPAHIDVYIDEDGSLNCHNSDLETQIEFDAWRYDRACEHENGDLISHRIGNIALVAYLRAELSRQPDDFLIVLSKVVYSGTHCGDFINRDTVQQMQPELERLAQFRCSDSGNQPFVDGFLAQLRELSAASAQTGNPIVF